MLSRFAMLLDLEEEEEHDDVLYLEGVSPKK